MRSSKFQQYHSCLLLSVENFSPTTVSNTEYKHEIVTIISH